MRSAGYADVIELDSSNVSKLMIDITRYRNAELKLAMCRINVITIILDCLHEV